MEVQLLIVDSVYGWKFFTRFGAGGYMRDVEIVNLAATASSVTPKTFNFTGVSGVETVNVGEMYY